ncbi:hypothetical protein ACIBCB_19960 [Streptomyces uncialis]|uniref:hypothetical protein n=1 Tax=Streptomyces uncialis TaxID=1048205 RepID=UPI0037B40F6E
MLGGAGAVVCAMMAIGAVWASVGPVGAAAGIGPADGVFTVSRCYATETNRMCEGSFAPADGTEHRNGVELGSPREPYTGGEQVEVRLAEATAYERSAVTVAFTIALALLLAGLYGATAAWLGKSARRGRFAGLGLYAAVMAVTSSAALSLLLVTGLLDWLLT